MPPLDSVVEWPHSSPSKPSLTGSCHIHNRVFNTLRRDPLLFGGPKIFSALCAESIGNPQGGGGRPTQPPTTHTTQMSANHVTTCRQGSPAQCPPRWRPPSGRPACPGGPAGTSPRCTAARRASPFRCPGRTPPGPAATEGACWHCPAQQAGGSEASRHRPLRRLLRYPAGSLGSQQRAKGRHNECAAGFNVKAVWRGSDLPLRMKRGAHPT